jgi:transposase
MAEKGKSPESVVRDIKRKTRRIFNAEEKIRIVLEGLKGEESIAAICRREIIHPNLYYKWSKEFLEAGKKRLAGDTIREATSSEVNDLRGENDMLKQVVAELMLKNRMLKKVRRVWNKAGVVHEVQPGREIRNYQTRGAFRPRCS